MFLIPSNLNASVETCTSNALREIIATPEDENSCTFSFTFILNSGYTATSYWWDFGDESFSQNETPIYKFSNYGPFTVCLTIIDQNGCTSKICTQVDPGNCDGGFCNYMVGEGCCVTVCVEEIQGLTWEVDMGNNKDYVYSIPGENVVSHTCYEDPGYYTVTLKYFDSNNDIVHTYIRNIYIPETGCGSGPCSYWVCFTDYYNYFGCVESVTYKLNGIEYEYVFPNGPISNTSYGVGLLIQEMYQLATNLGIQYANFDDLEICKKNEAVVHGHYFLNTSIEFISLNAAPDNVQCLPLNCPITPYCQQTVSTSYTSIPFKKDKNCN
jgi:hypothetical protein